MMKARSGRDDSGYYVGSMLSRKQGDLLSEAHTLNFILEYVCRRYVCIVFG